MKDQTLVDLLTSMQPAGLVTERRKNICDALFAISDSIDNLAAKMEGVESALVRIANAMPEIGDDLTVQIDGPVEVRTASDDSINVSGYVSTVE